MASLKTPEIVGVTKMSVKAIGCNPKAATALKGDNPPPIRLCIIYGRASGIKVGESAQGEYFALLGTFEAMNLEAIEENKKLNPNDEPYTEIYTSGKLFLPPGIHDSVVSAVRSAEGAAIEFAVEIRAVKANNPIGYSYQAINLLPASEVDDFSTARKAVQSALKGQKLLTEKK